MGHSDLRFLTISYNPCFLKLVINVKSSQTIIETKSERERRGHPTGHDVPYAAMGGITGFSSLAEGYMRLDDSGIGAPSKEFLEKPIGKVCIIINT